MRRTVVHWNLDLTVSAKGLGKFVHMENLDSTNCLENIQAKCYLYRGYSSGADPGYFLGGGALVSCSTLTPINHIVFFGRIPVVLENCRSSRGGGGGGAQPLHPPPRSAPVVNDEFQRPAFPDLNNLCNKHLYTKLLSQFWAVHSYGTRDTGTGKKNS